MRRRDLRAVVALAAAIALTATVAGCAGGSPASIAVTDETVVVDVRTPAEYAEGHLEGAVNIDLQDSGFEEAITALDDDGQYVVYCRSGNRSAQAASLMEAEGLDVIDAGGVDEAADATGLPILP
ncbi:MAG: rhodanese [Microbacterium sp.]|uniref:rhodanese-like domain-containing protein n=1 Tax=Microbacterium aquimaris TaxID=459816 RepID=UPI000C8B73DD|nr:rhodanese-like domain-containing protein [Microbacterium aquimaris]MAP64689.1 rhodanese [Microbacterium sp.]MDZ8276414.1 rhodanese-like domain-containing protein [Microbacterium aquimaris]